MDLQLFLEMAARCGVLAVLVAIVSAAARSGLLVAAPAIKACGLARVSRCLSWGALFLWTTLPVLIAGVLTFAFPVDVVFGLLGAVGIGMTHLGDSVNSLLDAAFIASAASMILAFASGNGSLDRRRTGMYVYDVHALWLN